MTARTLLEANRPAHSSDRFHQPENFDTVAEGSGWVMMAGGNDWEGCATAAAVVFTHADGDAERIWIKLKFPKELKAIASGDAEQSKRPDATAHAEKMWKAWLKAAKEHHKADEFSNWKRAFEEAAKAGGDFAEEWGMDQTVWKAMAVAEALLKN